MAGLDKVRTSFATPQQPPNETILVRRYTEMNLIVMGEQARQRMKASGISIYPSKNLRDCLQKQAHAALLTAFTDLTQDPDANHLIQIAGAKRCTTKVY